MNEKIDYKFDDGTNVYFTSDTHFHHDMIRQFCNRPFDSMEEMDNAMIERWNNTVPKDGIVFHLGDFAWGGYNVWKNAREQLNGEIILIKGNHDFKNMTATAKELFKDVCPQMRIEIEGRKAWLNHFPLLCYSGTYRDLNGLEYNLFGHVHLSNHLERNRGLDYQRCVDTLFSTQYDVGVDFNNFAPISWHDVNERIQKQINEVKTIKMWIKDESTDNT